MTDRKKQKPGLKKSPIYLTLLLVQFILINLGSLPLKIIKFILILAQGGYLRTQRALDSMKSSVSEAISRRTLALASKRVWLPTGVFLHRHRGRPKKFSTLLLSIPSPIRVTIILSLFLSVFFTYTLATFQAANSLPTPNKLISSDRPLTTEFFDRKGNLLYRLYEGRNRSLIEIDRLPPYLIQATIAIEDKNFYSHLGIDLSAMLRALYHNIKDGSLEGASTITQQLIKNTLLTPEKTYSRKIKEVILAFWAERIYSKNEILQMYFNEAPYGGPAWGIEAASQMYFGKSAHDLNLSQSSFLAGLPASPTEYSPYGTKPHLAKVRQKEVLKRMYEEGYISQKEMDTAYSEELNLIPPKNGIKAPHFVMYVRDFLSQKYGPRVVSQGGLKITTTLDLMLQEEVERIVSEEVSNLDSLHVQNGAAMVTDAKTGQILSMVGSKDYYYPNFGNYNVTIASRQPGSSIKPITYAESFKKGFSPGNTILDTPATFKDGANRPYKPTNYDGKFHGPVSIRVALGSSYNIPAVKLLATVGVDNMVNLARAMGITTFQNPQDYGLSLTLGGGEIKMIDMMSVYGTFSQMGVKKVPTPVIKVTDSNGNILEEYQNTNQVILQEDIAYLITDILADNKARTPAFGPNSLLNIPGQFVAVKTGTSDSKRDNWTFGYTTDFVVGVWVGNNDNSPMHPSLSSGVTGAAPIWNKIMKGILAKHPAKPFPRPVGIIDSTIDGRKDLSAAGILPQTLVRIKKGAEKTTFFDSFSAYATASAQAANPTLPNP